MKGRKGREAGRKTSERIMGAKGDTVLYECVELVLLNIQWQKCAFQKNSLTVQNILETNEETYSPVQSNTITHSGSEFVFRCQCNLFASHVANCVHRQLDMADSSVRRVQVYVAVVRDVLQRQQVCLLHSH